MLILLYCYNDVKQASLLLSVGSDGVDNSPAATATRPPVAGDDDYVPDMGGQKRCLSKT